VQQNRHGHFCTYYRLRSVLSNYNKYLNSKPFSNVPRFRLWYCSLARKTSTVSPCLSTCSGIFMSWLLSWSAEEEKGREHDQAGCTSTCRNRSNMAKPNTSIHQTSKKYNILLIYWHSLNINITDIASVISKATAKTIKPLKNCTALPYICLRNKVLSAYVYMAQITFTNFC